MESKGVSGSRYQVHVWVSLWVSTCVYNIYIYIYIFLFKFQLQFQYTYENNVFATTQFTTQKRKHLLNEQYDQKNNEKKPEHKNHNMRRATTCT